MHVHVHPVLAFAAKLVTGLGVACLISAFLSCIAIAIVAGPDSIDINRADTCFLAAVFMFGFITPGTILLCCVSLIRRGSTGGVTVALVISSLQILFYGLLATVSFVGVLEQLNYRGSLEGVLLSLVVSLALFVTSLLAVIKLGRCYGVINSLGVSHRRGFEPLVHNTIRPDAPSDKQWPQITP
jgi:hypothetical protein